MGSEQGMPFGRFARLAGALGMMGVLSAAAASSIPTTFAALTAGAVQPGNTFSLAALYAPVTPAATAAGHSAAISWAPPARNLGNGFVVGAVNNGTNAATACPTTPASYVFVTSVASSATTVTDSSASAYTAATEGSYECYLVRSGYAPAAAAPGWTANPGWISADAITPVAVQTGFVVTSVTFTNGGVSGSLDTNDTITLVFNQATNRPAFSGSVCAEHSSGTVWLAQPGTGSCTATGTLGALTGGTLSSSANKDGRYNATYTWSSATSLVVKITGLAYGSINSLSAATRTLTPGVTGITSATGALALCTVNPAAGLCQPTTTSLP